MRRDVVAEGRGMEVGVDIAARLVHRHYPWDKGPLQSGVVS